MEKDTFQRENNQMVDLLAQLLSNVAGLRRDITEVRAELGTIKEQIALMRTAELSEQISLNKQSSD